MGEDTTGQRDDAETKESVEEQEVGLMLFKDIERLIWESKRRIRSQELYRDEKKSCQQSTLALPTPSFNAYSIPVSFSRGETMSYLIANLISLSLTSLCAAETRKDIITTGGYSEFGVAYLVPYARQAQARP